MQWFDKEVKMPPMNHKNFGVCHKKFGSPVYILGLILGWHPANERRRYKVTLSLIGWAQT